MGPFQFEMADVEFFIGAEVGQVIIDPFAIRIMFVEPYSIYVEAACALEQPTEPKSILYYFSGSQEGTAGLRDFRLHKLLGRRVERVAVDGTSFRLEFKDGYGLTVMSLDGSHESGHISGPHGMEVF